MAVTHSKHVSIASHPLNSQSLQNWYFFLWFSEAGCVTFSGSSGLLPFFPFQLRVVLLRWGEEGITHSAQLILQSICSIPSTEHVHVKNRTHGLFTHKADSQVEKTRPKHGTLRNYTTCDRAEQGFMYFQQFFNKKTYIILTVCQIHYGINFLNPLWGYPHFTDKEREALSVKELVKVLSPVKKPGQILPR